MFLSSGGRRQKRELGKVNAQTSRGTGHRAESPEERAGEKTENGSPESGLMVKSAAPFPGASDASHRPQRLRGCSPDRLLLSTFSEGGRREEERGRWPQGSSMLLRHLSKPDSTDLGPKLSVVSCILAPTPPDSTNTPNTFPHPALSCAGPSVQNTPVPYVCWSDSFCHLIRARSRITSSEKS